MTSVGKARTPRRPNSATSGDDPARDHRGLGVGVGFGVGVGLGVGLGLALGLAEGCGVGDEAGSGEGSTTMTLTWGFSRRHCAHAWRYRS
jgi:hypothetical protein